jgi:hypothetical protein
MKPEHMAKNCYQKEHDAQNGKAATRELCIN